MVSDDYHSPVSLEGLVKKIENENLLGEISQIPLAVNEETIPLLFRAASSARFAKVKLCCFVSKMDINKEEQFAVVTFILDRKTAFIKRLGNKDYFTIVGHTPVNLAFGYEYHKEGNYLNIDGGSGVYATGDTGFNHFPLVEVCNGYLKILTFDSDNEIIFGNYFDGIGSTPFTTEELEREKLLIK